MEHRTLGRTGVSLSVVGFGAMTIGGNYGPVDDAQSLAALHAAVDAGMNFIDTSDAYGAGRSETVLARFLAERPDRDRIVVATKGGNDQTTGTTSFEPAYIARCVEASLSRLGCETLDLYLVQCRDGTLALRALLSSRHWRGRGSAGPSFGSSPCPECWIPVFIHLGGNRGSFALIIVSL